MRIPAWQLVAIFAVLLWLSPGLCGAGALPGGTAISNTVSATFADATDRNYAITSNIVTATIAKLAALVVTPKETQANSTTDGVAVGQNATRTFAITNTSNIPDAYRVTSLTTGALRLVSAEFVTPAGAPIGPATSSVSPAVQPGGSVDVVVVASTAGLSVGQSIPIQLTAETTATGTNNGLQSDTGEQWVVTATGPQLHGPSGPNAPVLKSVDGSTIVQAQPGGSVTFDIVAVNGGGSPATNVVVSDQLPTGLATTASTVNIDGTPAGAAAALSGQMLTVRVPALAAGATLDVSFVATVLQGDAVGQTIVNVASISADGIAAQNTTPASVLLGTADEVYSGLAGQKAPVAGATVTLLAANGQLPALQASAVRGASGSANANAQDPLITGPSGLYGFALSPSAIAASGSQFYLTIAAPGYLNRKIALTILPTLGASLYDVTAKAVDGQPLAVAGGYALTTKAVTLNDVVGLFGNVPLFASRTIVVSKSVDRQIAQPGDRLLYTVTFSNATNAPVGVTTVADTLPAGLVYGTGSGRLDGTPAEPTVRGRLLTWTLPALAPGANHTIEYAAIVYPSVADGTILDNTAIVNATIPGTTSAFSGSSSASVRVVAGAFSQRRVIVGRVFIDAMRTGRFTRGDTGVPGVRIFLEDGTSAVTDAQGRYSFPGVRPGMHVLRLDASTLPANARPYGGARMNSNRSLQRLVHGIFDDGVMDEIDFALEPVR